MDAYRNPSLHVLILHWYLQQRTIFPLIFLKYSWIFWESILLLFLWIALSRPPCFYLQWLYKPMMLTQRVWFWCYLLQYTLCILTHYKRVIFWLKYISTIFPESLYSIFNNLTINPVLKIKLRWNIDAYLLMHSWLL